MLFNSVDFAIFFLVVFLLYWFVVNRNLKLQNALLLVVSFFFYGWWDYRFLFLLLFSTLLDYFTGLQMFNSTTPWKKKVWFWLSISVNLGFLGFFKYYNFFIESFALALSSIGFQVNIWTLKIILPVGISFYTFHGMSYVIDIYNGRIKPTLNFIDYAVFVSFFPLLVAGPIERATHLLPQIQRPRTFDYGQAVDGIRQVLWGLFKKVVIADNCAKYADQIFGNYGSYSGSTLALGAIFFAFQIYGDFSGYSDMALGVAKLLGIDLLRNFAYPYFSRDIAEFWRRWHISLTTWFRDYLYIPLGGSKGNTFTRIRNTFIIFLVSGLWHGANWTFILWGLLNAVFFMPLLILNKNRVNLNPVAENRLLPGLRETLQILVTFCMTTFAWIFFRSESAADAFNYVRRMFSLSLFQMPSVRPLTLTGVVLLFVAAEWIQRQRDHPLQLNSDKLPTLIRWSIYYVIIALIIMYSGEKQDFIYFQF